MNGTIYLANDHVLTENFPVDSSVILVYQSTSGDVGFNSDVVGKKITESFLNGSWCICNDEPMKVTSNNTQKALNQATLSKKYGVFFHEASPDLLTCFQEITEYHKKLKVNKLKERMGKSIDNIEVPRVISYLNESDVNVEALASYCKSLCGFISIWPRYWGGLGEHFYIVKCCDDEVDSIVDNLCILHDCVKSIVDFSSIPIS